MGRGACVGRVADGRHGAAVLLGAGGYRAIRLPWVGITTFSQGALDLRATTRWWRRSARAAAARRAATAPATTGISSRAWRGSTSRARRPANDGWGPSGTAWNWIYAPATGQYAAAPSWSHDGTKVLFTMTNVGKSGRLSAAAPRTCTPCRIRRRRRRRRRRCRATARGQPRAVLRHVFGRRQADRLQRAGRDHGVATHPRSTGRTPKIPTACTRSRRRRCTSSMPTAATRCASRPTIRHLLRPAAKPGHQQQLAEVVAAGRDLGQPHVLLAHLLVVAGGQDLSDGRADRAALSHGGDARRDHVRRTTPPSISGTSPPPKQPHARLGFSCKFRTSCSKPEQHRPAATSRGLCPRQRSTAVPRSHRVLLVLWGTPKSNPTRRSTQ